MLVSILLFSMPLQQSATPELLEYRSRFEARLLEGGSLPADYRLELLEMPAAERIEAIIFLRRSGLLTGQSWRADDLLRSPKSMTEPEE